MSSSPRLRRRGFPLFISARSEGGLHVRKGELDLSEVVAGLSAVRVRICANYFPVSAKTREKHHIHCHGASEAASQGYSRLCCRLRRRGEAAQQQAGSNRAIVHSPTAPTALFFDPG